MRGFISGEKSQMRRENKPVTGRVMLKGLWVDSGLLTLVCMLLCSHEPLASALLLYLIWLVLFKHLSCGRVFMFCLGSERLHCPFKKTRFII